VADFSAKKLKRGGKKLLDEKNLWQNFFQNFSKVADKGPKIMQ